jgi:hypothetical protein
MMFSSLIVLCSIAVVSGYSMPKHTQRASIALQAEFDPFAAPPVLQTYVHGLSFVLKVELKVESNISVILQESIR